MACPEPVFTHCAPYIIQNLPAIPFSFEIHQSAWKFSIASTWALWLFYIAWQSLLVIRVQRNEPKNIQWQLWTALLSEILLDFSAGILALSISLGLFAVPNATPRARLALVGDMAPDVDILLTCCGEPVNVIYNTAAAAATQDYPPKRLRLYVLDDGNDEDLRKAIERLNDNLALKGARYAPVTYLARKLKPGEHSYQKSGNIRFGIHQSLCRYKGLSHGNNEDSQGPKLLAGLDADMIPESDWLRKMVPHLLLDENLGISCPPQRYYNVSSDPLGQQADFDLFFSIEEALNDRLGASMCTGTGYVARRSAIEDIGGWPLADSGEDYMCSAILSGRGWRVAYVSGVSYCLYIGSIILRILSSRS